MLILKTKADPKGVQFKQVSMYHHIYVYHLLFTVQKCWRYRTFDSLTTLWYWWSKKEFIMSCSCVCSRWTDCFRSL